MIQRIQSLFLLLASGAAGALFGAPVLQSDQAVESSSFLNDQIFTITDSVPLMAFFGLTIAISLIAIFLFRNRKLQMRLALFAIMTTMAGIGYAIGTFFAQGLAEVDSLALNWGIILPVISVLFLGLAMRFIKKDDTIVKSMDRLR